MVGTELGTTEEWHRCAEPTGFRFPAIVTTDELGTTAALARDETRRCSRLLPADLCGSRDSLSADELGDLVVVFLQQVVASRTALTLDPQQFPTERVETLHTDLLTADASCVALLRHHQDFAAS
jgi:hypothetical protein